MAKFQIYKDRSDEYRWRLRASNGKILADSGEGYSSKSACERGVELVKSEAPDADVDDLT